MDMLYTPFWQALGAILFAAVIFGSVYSFYLISPKDDGEDDYA